MSGLDAADARKLQGSLARLGSSHDGEVVAAARAVGRILAKAGLSFADLAATEAPDPSPPAERIRNRADRLLNMTGCGWSLFERSFLLALLDYTHSLSPKQRRVLSELEAKAERVGARARP